MVPQQIEPAARANMGGIKRWWERANAGITTTGSAGAYIITPTNTSYPTAYTQGEIYGGKANFTSVGNDTLNVNGKGAKKIYVQGASGPTSISAGDIVSGQQFLVAYDGALNSSAGGFQLLSAPTANATSSVPGTVNVVNGRMSVTSPGVTATFTADEILTETALAGTAYKLSGYSKAVDLSTNGVGGMDTGSAPLSGYVSLYAINKADGTTSILACNVTTSSAEVYGGGSMPANYVASALLGVWPTNGSGQFPVGFQTGRSVYRSPVSYLPTADGTYHSLSISSGVAPSAKKVRGSFLCLKNSSTTLEVTISSDSGTTIITIIGYFVATATQSGGGGSYEVPIITSQTLYVFATTGASLTFYVNGYDF